MRYLGNLAAGQAVNLLFSTNDGSGAAVAPTTAGSIRIYKDAGTAEATAGITYTPSFDGVTGVNLAAVDTSDAFFETGHDYTIVLVGAVIDGETVNAVLATFAIEHRYPAPSENADTLLDRPNAIEAGATPRQALRAVAAVLAGKVSGAGSGIERFTGLDGATSRVEVTTDSVGNRTAVGYSLD